MNSQGKVLEVWHDCDLGPPCLVGTLARDRGQIRFQYDSDWLSDDRAFALDPDLSLAAQPFFPRAESATSVYSSTPPQTAGERRS